MSTLTVVEEVLRTSGAPISVREIVDRAGARLPSKSKTPDTVVARDLAMDIKRQGDASRFVRTSPGRYTLRELVAAPLAASQPAAPSTMTVQPPSLATAALKQERAAALPAKSRPEAPRAALRNPASTAG